MKARLGVARGESQKAEDWAALRFQQVRRQGGRAGWLQHHLHARRQQAQIDQPRTSAIMTASTASELHQCQRCPP